MNTKDLIDSIESNPFIRANAKYFLKGSKKELNEQNGIQAQKVS